MCKGYLPVDSENIVLDVENVIKELDQDWTYKYVGVNEGNLMQHSEMKRKSEICAFGEYE